MGLRPTHPGFVPDPPDVAADFASLRCPAVVVLCGGESPAEAASMVPFRSGLAQHLATTLPGIRVEWLRTGHLLVVSKPRETAALITPLA